MHVSRAHVRSPATPAADASLSLGVTELAQRPSDATRRRSDGIDETHGDDVVALQVEHGRRRLGRLLLVVRGRVCMPALVRSDHHPWVLCQPLDPLLHTAIALRTPVVAPADEQITDRQCYLHLTETFTASKEMAVVDRVKDVTLFGRGCNAEKLT
ncbi:hypothetical protein BHM03_00020999 [Ensete ventricosum]|uniref:Uncharacterized protein n=1 Tax=Ensete ventricosum TaxID=4639 RepID=A0A445MFX6_ENSVE|nr:hypothetical protein BHM03_00020999 [Ensete ventricosum]